MYLYVHSGHLASGGKMIANEIFLCVLFCNFEFDLQ